MASFHTTHWSIVLGARVGTAEGRDSLARLCEAYWPPVYAYVRGQGETIEDARDLTQEFFAVFIEKHYVSAADPARGRFRSFLLASVRHFLCNEWDRQHRKKRGGSAPHVSIDMTTEDGQPQHERSTAITPELVFEQRWAATLLQRALSRLREEQSHGGRGEIFEALLPLLCEQREESYAQIGHRLNATAGALRVAVHRLRRRFRTLLLEEIADTVADARDIEGELQYLLRVVQQSPATQLSPEAM